MPSSLSLWCDRDIIYVPRPWEHTGLYDNAARFPPILCVFVEVICVNFRRYMQGRLLVYYEPFPETNDDKYFGLL